MGMEEQKPLRPEDELVKTLHELIRSNEKVIKGPPLWRSFLSGAASAVGATIGAAIIITLLAALLGRLEGVSFFKPAVQTVLPYVQQATKHSPSPERSETIIYDSPSPDLVASPTPSSTPTE
jgi:hypothetical protein